MTTTFHPGHPTLCNTSQESDTERLFTALDTHQMYSFALHIVNNNIVDDTLEHN